MMIRIIFLKILQKNKKSGNKPLFLKYVKKCNISKC